MKVNAVLAAVALTLVAAALRAADPAVTIMLHDRHGHGTPHRQGCTHTGGGNIDVAQPAPDTLVVTMTGVAVATGHPCTASAAGLDFDLTQCFEVSFGKDVKAAKLTLEARVIGLLRSHCKGGGSAEQGKACAAVACGEAPLVSLCVPPHSACGGENLSVNCREGQASVAVGPGKYTLHQVFQVSAAHPKAILPCKAASAEFAPDPALDPLWISAWEPFKGAQKKDFGFQVTVKVAAEAPAEEAKNGKANAAGEKAKPGT